MKKTYGILAFLFASLSLVVAEPRILALTGRGSVGYKPDYVDLGFSVVSKAPGYAEAQMQNLHAVEAAMDTLGSVYAVKREDITTLDYRLGEDIVYEEGRQKRLGYVSTTRMSVRIRELGTYRPIIVSLLDAGVNSIDSISFGVEDWASLREKALLAAYADADKKARALAESAGLKLGAPLQIRESSSEQPQPLPILAKASFRAEAVGNGEVISSGSPLFEAEVYVEYALK